MTPYILEPRALEPPFDLLVGMLVLVTRRVPIEGVEPAPIRIGMLGNGINRFHTGPMLLFFCQAPSGIAIRHMFRRSRLGSLDVISRRKSLTT